MLLILRERTKCHHTTLTIANHFTGHSFTRACHLPQSYTVLYHIFPGLHQGQWLASIWSRFVIPLITLWCMSGKPSGNPREPRMIDVLTIQRMLDNTPSAAFSQNPEGSEASKRGLSLVGSRHWRYPSCSEDNLHPSQYPVLSEQRHHCLYDHIICTCT